VINLVGVAAMAILVLYARELLHLTDTEYGFLLIGEAAGAIIGTAIAPRVSVRLGAGRALVVAVIAAGVSFVIPALWTQPLVVAASLALGGCAGLVWNIITVSLRQTLVPDALLGRVNSAYRMIGWGSMPIGALLGGIVADRFGLRAPFAIAAAACAVLALWLSTTVTTRAIERARRRSRWTAVDADGVIAVDLVAAEEAEPAAAADPTSALRDQRPSGAR
jgi:MFS family permease